MEKLEKIARFRKMNKTVQYGETVCAGSSLMEMFPVEELAKEAGFHGEVYNRGVGGFVTAELMKNLDVCILDLKPGRLFLNIGTNDLSDPDVTIDVLCKSYSKILDAVQSALPQTEIYLMAYYPVNPDAAQGEMKNCLKIRTNKRINQANDMVQALAEKYGARYIDVNGRLKDEKGRLKREFTIEGMHINKQGYCTMFPDFLNYLNEPSWK